MPSKTKRADNFSAGVADHEDNDTGAQTPADVLLNALLPASGVTSPAAAPEQPRTLPDEEGLTLGEVLPGLASVDEASLPGFAMSDDPLPPPTAQGHPGAEFIPPMAASMFDPGLVDDTLKPYAQQDELPEAVQREVGTITPPNDAFTRPGAGSVRYEGRIQILDAFQYPGVLANAPDWVDRNWIAFGDHDDLRGIPAGPCLRVPLTSGATAICRVGDYVCQQEVRMAPDTRGEVRIEVWPKEQFQKNFMPV